MTSRHPFCGKVFTLVGLIAVAIPALGREEPGDHNLREACRKEVAGTYLSLYDEREKNAAFLAHWREQSRVLAKALAATQLEHAQLQKALAQSPYDAEQSSRRGALQAKIKMLEETLASGRSIQERTLSEQAGTEAELKDFTKRMDPIFRIEPIRGNGDGYRFQVNYRLECPSYRFSCPLSRTEAAKLKALYKGGKIPAVCAKYADFLQW